MELLKTPIDLPCRTCGAQARQDCTTKPRVEAQWVKVLEYFHSTRWRDFNVARNEAAAFNDWGEKYGGVNGSQEKQEGSPSGEQRTSVRAVGDGRGA